MKKIVSVMLAIVILCMAAVPAFAVSNCKAGYENGKVTYSCDGNTQIEVYLDGGLLASKGANSISGHKTVQLAPGTHSVTFSDLDGTKTVTFEVVAATEEPSEEPSVEPTEKPVVDNNDDEDEVPKTGDASTTMAFVIGGMMLIAAAWLCVVRVAANRK